MNSEHKLVKGIMILHRVGLHLTTDDPAAPLLLRLSLELATGIVDRSASARKAVSTACIWAALEADAHKLYGDPE